MFARVTLLEIDTMRISVEEAVAVFDRGVLPALREQPGYRGVYAFTTPEGKAMLLSFWDTAEQADASGDRGWYPETLNEYMTMFSSPPGREHYEVRVVEPPVMATEGS